MSQIKLNKKIQENKRLYKEFTKLANSFISSILSQNNVDRMSLLSSSLDSKIYIFHNLDLTLAVTEVYDKAMISYEDSDPLFKFIKKKVATAIVKNLEESIHSVIDPTLEMIWKKPNKKIKINLEDDHTELHKLLCVLASLNLLECIRLNITYQDEEYLFRFDRENTIRAYKIKPHFVGGPNSEVHILHNNKSINQKLIGKLYFITYLLPDFCAELKIELEK